MSEIIYPQDIGEKDVCQERRLWYMWCSNKSDTCWMLFQKAAGVTPYVYLGLETQYYDKFIIFRQCSVWLQIADTPSALQVLTRRFATLNTNYIKSVKLKSEWWCFFSCWLKIPQGQYSTLLEGLAMTMQR